MVSHWPEEAIEGGGSADGVGAHVLEPDPLPDGEVWQQGLVTQLVQTITRGAPDAAGREPSRGEGGLGGC